MKQRFSTLFVLLVALLPASASADALEEGRKLTALFYAGDLDAVWQQMSEQMEEVFKGLEKTKRNLYFIDGSTVSDDSMLDDGVHLSAAGAEKLFGNLKGPIGTILGKFAAL